MSCVFVDVDGVAAAFVQAALKLHNKNLPWNEIRWDFAKQIDLTPSDFWSPMGETFWAGIEKTAECDGVLAAVFEKFAQEKVFLLTSPCTTPGCITGKARWVEKHLPGFSRRLLMTNVKELFAARGRVLIDDRQENCDSWRACGGRAFVFPRPWNSGSSRELSAVEDLRNFLETL